MEPPARQAAIARDIGSLSQILETPNNILAVEYLKAHPGKLENMPLGACAVTTSIDNEIPPGIVFCLRAEGVAAEKAIDPSYPLAPHFRVLALGLQGPCRWTLAR